MADSAAYEIARRRRVLDRGVTLAINAAGAAVIALIFFMLLFLVYVAYPLADDARESSLETQRLSRPYAKTVSDADGMLWALPQTDSMAQVPDENLTDAGFVVQRRGERLDLLALISTLGTTADTAMDVEAVAALRGTLMAPGIRDGSLAFDVHEGRALVAYYDQVGALHLLRLSLGDGIPFAIQSADSRSNPVLHEGSLLPDASGDRLLIVDGDRYVLWTLDASAPGARLFGGQLSGLSGAVDAVAWGPGNETLIVAAGRSLHRFDASRPGLPRLAPALPTTAAVSSLDSERLRRVTLLGQEDGHFTLLVPTSGEILRSSHLPGFDPGIPLRMSEDGAYIYQTDGREIRRWALRNVAPETGWRSLWLAQWYGAYDAPAYVWHPDGASIGVLSKFSLSPLIFGTLKAAIYGMLMALPMALGAAVYTGYFMTPRLRNQIKPAVEMLEAFPTVVLGFLAGLWLAPLLIDYLVLVFLLPLLLVMVPLTLALAHLILQNISPRFMRRPPRVRLIAVAYLVCLGLLFAHAGHLEELFFGGSVRDWIWSNFGLRYDQRNALLVGLAMGIAIVPTVFSISEDALHAVPRALSDGSLALGATRWQSLARVVLPAASPAILSAVLIGLARGLGETMIVLLATGNTPILETSLFTGLQSLSAAVAMELPEASIDGVHFRLLFLAALVLFGLTFVLNTIAEVFRQRLRYSYGQL